MMQEHLLLTLAAVGVLGGFAQWISWWFKLPAILFLLIIGIVIGPWLGLFHPDDVFGDLLFPIVSLAVAVILFEGALTLDIKQSSGIESVVLRLVSIGMLSTWLLIGVATHFIMGFEWSLAMLFGALVVVTGPTVIVPMLRTVRPTQKISNILRWEGILIDPIGALLAVLVFDFIIATSSGEGLGHVLFLFTKTLLTGLLLGAVTGHLLGIALRKHWIPEYLQNMITLTLVFGVFAISNSLAPESGLLTVTVMGMWLANMKDVSIREILSFKENLTIFLISGLFIILAARLDFNQFAELGWPALGIFVVIQFIARPVKVFLATLGSDVTTKERVLLSWIAPRGIVAAAVSALFAIRLEDAGYEQAPLLVSLTFMVIIGTVLLQSATARPLAKALGVAEPEPRGILIIGANKVARAVAKALNDAGFRTLLTDSYWRNYRDANLVGLNAFWGNAISEHADRTLDLVGLGRLIGLSQNDHLNVLAAQRYKHEFGANNIFSLPPVKRKSSSGKTVASQGQRGKTLFSEEASYNHLKGILDNDGEVKLTRLTEEFTYQDYLAEYADRVVPLFIVTRNGNLRPIVLGDSVKPSPGSKIIGMIGSTKENNKAP